MSGMEKLLVQIMERKRRIIAAAKAQTDGFHHYLASKCILQGMIPPPSFLIFPPLSSSSPSQLNKEELVLGVLFPRPHYANQYLESCYLLHQGRAPDAQNQGSFEEGTSSDVCALDRGVALAATDRLSVSPQLPTSDAQCVLNTVPEVDAAVASPQVSRDVDILESCCKQPESLVKIERSKSRQRALELRNSAKAAKTRPWEYRAVNTQPGYPYEPWSVKHVEMSNEMCVEEEENQGEGMVKECSGERITRSEDSAQRVGGFQNEPEIVCNSLYNAREADLGQSIDRLVIRSGHHHELLNNVYPPIMAALSSAAEDTRGNDCIQKSRITRSTSSSLRPSAGKKISTEEGSCYVAKDLKRPTHFTDGSAQLPNDVNHSGELVKPVSVMPSGSKCSRKSIGCKRSIEREADCYFERLKRSRSSVQQPNSANECFKLDSSSDYGKENAVGSLKRQSNQADDSGNDVRPVDISKSVLQGHEGENNANHGEEVSSSCSSETQLPKRDSSSFVENHGNEMFGQPFAELLQPPPSGLVDKRVDHPRVLGTHTQALPTSQGSYIAELDKSVVIEAGSKVDSGRPIENALASGSNTDVVDLVTEILDSRSPGENAIFVKPIQLDFDGTEEGSLVEMCVPVEHCLLGAETLTPEVQHEVGPHTEVVGQSAMAAPVRIHEQILALSGTSFTKSLSKVSLGCLEDAELAELTSGIQVEGGQQAINESLDLLHSANRLEVKSAEVLTSDKETVNESKSELLTFDELTLHTKSIDIGNHNFAHGSVVAPCCQPTEWTAADQTMPKFEGFVIEADDEQASLCAEGINFSKLDLPGNLLERAIVIERLCKSACMHTPISKFPTAYKLQQELKLYQSMPNGLLEGMELWSTVESSRSPGKQLDASYSSMAKGIDCSFHEKNISDSQPSSSAQSVSELRKPCTSPVRKLWDGIILKPSSSEKCTSSIPELPCINEENENADEATDMFDGVQACKEINKSVKRDALADLTRNSNLPKSVRENGVLDDNGSADLVKENSVICSDTKGKLRNRGRKGRYANVEKENQSISVGVNDSKRANDSLEPKAARQKLSEKSSFRKGIPSLRDGESNRNNIVSNITSFIPLVQQKQAPSAIAGKREVKVKALEAAEAAKRLAEKRENERKMKKEALKRDRARMEEKILRQLEVEREKKEEERKKKETDMAARKRQREEEEKKKGRKRNCVEKPKRQQEERSSVQKHSKDISRKHEKMQKTKGENSLPQVLECEPTRSKISINDTSKGSILIEANETSNNYETKATSDFCEGAKINSLTPNIDQEPSYEISPYKSSDDEDEEDDDKQNFKFVPSWTSKSRLAHIIASQRIDPEQIFPPQSFCSTAEVLTPRRL